VLISREWEGRAILFSALRRAVLTLGSGHVDDVRSDFADAARRIVAGLKGQSGGVRPVGGMRL